MLVQFWRSLPALRSLVWRDVRPAPTAQRRWSQCEPEPPPAEAAPALRALRSLRLEYCGLSTLPAHVLHGCPALLELGLEGNAVGRCEALTELVAANTGLTRLALDNCSIQYIPYCITLLCALRELSLAQQHTGLRVSLVGWRPPLLRTLVVSSEMLRGEDLVRLQSAVDGLKVVVQDRPGWLWEREEEHT